MFLCSGRRSRRNIALLRVAGPPRRVAVPQRVVDRPLAEHGGHGDRGSARGEQRDEQPGRPGHLHDERDAGHRRADDRGEQRAHADRGERGDRGGERRPCRLGRASEERAGDDADHEQRREQSAGNPGRVRQRAEREPHHEDEEQDRDRVAAVESLLDQHLAAAHDPWHEERHQPDDRADGRGTRRGGNASEALHEIERADDRAAVGEPEQPDQPPEREEQQVAGEEVDLERRDREDVAVADDRAHHRQAAAAGGERRDRRPELEAAQELLEHEDRAGERRVECGGEPRARAGGEQDSGVRGAEAEAAREEVTERRAHLHRRTLPAERETGADRQRAADELDRKDRSAYRARVAADHRLDVLDAAARRLGREPRHQPARDEGRGGGEADRDDPADPRVAHATTRARRRAGHPRGRGRYETRYRPARQARRPPGRRARAGRDRCGLRPRPAARRASLVHGRCPSDRGRVPSHASPVHSPRGAVPPTIAKAVGGVRAVDNKLSRRRSSSTTSARAAPVRDERAGERRPAGLVRRAEPFAGVAVEVLVEQQLVAPRGIALEERGLPVHRPPAAAVEQEQLDAAGARARRPPRPGSPARPSRSGTRR